jgi:hypothetical protein
MSLVEQRSNIFEIGLCQMKADKKYYRTRCLSQIPIFLDFCRFGRKALCTRYDLRATKNS